LRQGSSSAALPASRRLSGAILLAALGVLAAALPARGDADCVTISRPKAGVKYAFRFTDAAGTVSTSTTEYLAVSDTSVRLRLTHSGAFGSTLRVEDDLVVTEKMVSSGANAGGAFENTVTFPPARIGDPASRVCSGRTWTIPSVSVSTLGSQGGRAEMATDPGHGRVISVRESVTVPAGTFQTVHYEKVFDGANGHVVEETWQSIADGGALAV